MNGRTSHVKNGDEAGAGAVRAQESHFLVPASLFEEFVALLTRVASCLLLLRHKGICLFPPATTMCVSNFPYTEFIIQVELIVNTVNMTYVPMLPQLDFNGVFLFPGFLLNFSSVICLVATNNLIKME